MEFIYYESSTGRSPVKKSLQKRGPNFYRKFLKIILRLSRDPELMDKKHIRDGIYELRIWPEGQVCRPLYAYIVEGKCLILHIVDHLDGKAEDGAVEVAVERLKDWKMQENE